MRLPRVIWITFALLLTTMHGRASAVVVDFTQVSIGAQGTIDFEGVTITANDEFWQVALVAGEGLGLAGVESSGSIDLIYQRYFDSEGNYLSSSSSDGTLSMSVDGRINAVTIAPYMTIDGPAPIAGIPMGFTTRFDTVTPDLGDGRVERYMFYASAPSYEFTFPLVQECDPDCRPTGLDLFGLNSAAVFSDFRPYEVSQSFPEYTVRFGYSILSVDYTPTQVTEPMTLALLSTGLVALKLYGRRARKRVRVR